MLVSVAELFNPCTGLSHQSRRNLPTARHLTIEPLALVGELQVAVLDQFTKLRLRPLRERERSRAVRNYSASDRYSETTHL